MSFLVSLLLFLGVIASPDQVTDQNAAQYEAEYATQENVNAFYRNNDPSEYDDM